jgi:hypothetical protein
MYFEIVSEIADIEVIAKGRGVQGLARSSGHWIELMKTTSAFRFAICLKNKGSEDLIVRKVYQVLPDERAEKQGLLRIVGESGEDCLYPASYFFIDLPQKVERALRQSVSAAA